MRDTVRLGRLMGVPIGVNWSLVAIVVIFAFGLEHNLFPTDAPGYGHGAYILAGALTAVALLVGVLLHELGHAIVARRCGLEVDGITLSWMGGLTRISGDTPSPRRELWVAGVGPLVSLVLGGLLLAGREVVVGAGSATTTLLVAALGWLAVINVVLALFNLIPASPLDGGRILHAAVWGVTHDRWRAGRVAARAGLGLAVAVALLGAYEVIAQGDRIDGVFVLVLAWWLWGAAHEEDRQVGLHDVLGGLAVCDLMRPVGAAPGWMRLDEFVGRYVDQHPPTCVWLLERWGGGYGGVVSSEALRAVARPWNAVRAGEIAIPVDAAGEVRPDEDLLAALERTGGRQILLAVEAGRTVGAVLPVDVETAMRSRRRPAVAPPIAAGVR